MPMALTPYGGWHKEDKDLAESWTRKTIHTGDGVGYCEFIDFIGLQYCGLIYAHTEHFVPSDRGGTPPPLRGGFRLRTATKCSEHVPVRLS